MRERTPRRFANELQIELKTIVKFKTIGLRIVKHMEKNSAFYIYCKNVLKLLKWQTEIKLKLK